MTNLEASRVNFSKHLADSLLMKYKKQVSIVFFVDQFNLRAYGTDTISYETGRKWIKGLSIPKVSKMNVLVKWLNIDAKKIFEYDHDIRDKINSAITDSSLKIKNNDNLFKCLQSVVINLDTNAQSFLLLSALTLKELSFNQNLDMDYKLLVKQFSLSDIYTKK
jgi:hypothetical protein